MNFIRSLTIIFLLTLPSLLLANKVDSLRYAINQTEEDTTLLRLHNEIAALQIDTSFLAAKANIDTAMTLAIRLNDKVGLAHAVYNQGRNLAIHRHYDEAKNSIQHAIDLLSVIETEAPKLVSAYIVLGWIYDKQTDYYTALIYFKKANELAEQLNHAKGISSSSINIGKTYYLLGNKAKAIQYYEKAKESYEEQNNKIGLVYYFNNMGFISYDKGAYNEALENYNQAKDLSIELDMIRMEAHITQNIILSLIELDRLDAATNLTHRVVEIDTKIGDEVSLAYLSILKAKIDLKKGLSNSHVIPLQAAYIVGLNTKDLELQRSSAELLAKIYEQNGDFQKALVQSTLSFEIKDSISSDEVRLRIRNLESSKALELKKKDALIVETNLKKSLEKQTLIKQILIFPLGLLSIFLFFLHRAYKIAVESKRQLQIQNLALEETESKLEEQNKDLKRYIDQNIELEQFAHIASHDIKSPLRTISSFTGLIRKQLTDTISDKQKEYFKMVEQGISRLDSLVDDLLNFSVENALELNVQELNSREVFDEVIQNLATDIQKSEAKLITLNEVVNFKGDKIKIKQIVQNLLSNSIKFRSKRKPLIIELNCFLKDEYCFISVKDNGIGMDEKYKKKVFEKFTQLNSKDEYEGTGLGLSLCKKYVEKHKGKIWIVSQPNVGTKISFSINQSTLT